MAYIKRVLGLLLIFSLFFILYSQKVFASTSSYLVTNGFQTTGNEGIWGRVLFIKNLYIPFELGGKVILSRNSDGTGLADVGDFVQAHTTGSLTLNFNAYRNNCSTPLIQMPPQDITFLFSPFINNLLVRFSNWCAIPKTVGQLYVVYFPPGSIPTPTPTPTSTPTPIPAPSPFLDLPWDYEGKGNSFEQVALNPVSWFDHEYPLQNIPCCMQQVLYYKGRETIDFYRSHNGYDYGLKNGVELNTPVLAAASGWVTFKSWQNSFGAGNVIKIDHGNRYQTWYEHLSGEGLVLDKEGERVFVNQGQTIGRVGMTGNTSGPHIHFSVFKDSNNNGSFDDEIPYGVVDPLGWEGASPDPWPLWTSNGRTGTQSFNLFINRAQPKSTIVSTSGGSFNLGSLNLTVPQDALSGQLTITKRDGPFESASNLINSTVPSFFLNAANNLGQTVTQFLKPLSLTYDYSDVDLLNINEDSLKLYWLNDQTNQWDPLVTSLDKNNKTVSSQTTHFSQFALMGEVKDLIAPTTDVIVTGQKGQNNWYRSNVTVQLNGKDNDGGVGLQYTVYSLNDNDWLEYETPLIFSQEGSYKITYQSFDKAENKEERKALEFNIDKTLPKVSIDAYPKTLWPPNGKMVNVTVTGNSSDDHLFSTDVSVEDEYHQVEPTIIDFEQTIQLESKRNGGDLDGRMYIIKAVVEDLAGNKIEEQTQVIVPHDKRKEEK